MTRPHYVGWRNMICWLYKKQVVKRPTFTSLPTNLLTTFVLRVMVTESWERIMYDAAFKSTHRDWSPVFKLWTSALTISSAQLCRRCTMLIDTAVYRATTARSCSRLSAPSTCNSYTESTVQNLHTNIVETASITSSTHKSAATVHSESAACDYGRPNIPSGGFQTLQQRHCRLSDCWHIASSAETFLFWCFFSLTLALFLCLVYFPMDLEVFYLGHVKNLLTIQYNTNSYGFPHILLKC